MLYNIISSIKGNKIAHLVTLTDVRLPKKLGLGSVVTKRSEGQVQINSDYNCRVNNALARQGNDCSFVSETLPWGKWELNNKVINYNGCRYLRYYYQRNSPMKVEYYVDGRPATQDEVTIIKAYINAHSKGSAKQEMAGLAKGDQVKLANVKFDNILEFKVNGYIYKKSN